MASDACDIGGSFRRSLFVSTSASTHLRGPRVLAGCATRHGAGVYVNRDCNRDGQAGRGTVATPRSYTAGLSPSGNTKLMRVRSRAPIGSHHGRTPPGTAPPT